MSVWKPERKIAAALATALVIAVISWGLDWNLNHVEFFGLVMAVVGVGYVVPSKET